MIKDALRVPVGRCERCKEESAYMDVRYMTLIKRSDLNMSIGNFYGEESVGVNERVAILSANSHFPTVKFSRFPIREAGNNRMKLIGHC